MGRALGTGGFVGKFERVQLYFHMSVVAQVGYTAAIELQLPAEIRSVLCREANQWKAKSDADLCAEGLAFLTMDPDLRPALWEAGAAGFLHRHLGDYSDTLHQRLVAEANLLRISGLPTDGLTAGAPYGASVSFRQLRAKLVSMFGVIGAMNALAFSYADENQGRIIRHVVARTGAEGELSSQGWGLELPWHMDGAYRPLSDLGSNEERSLWPAPRWLVFGVMNAGGIPLTFVPVDTVVARLEKPQIRTLCQPIYCVHSPDSFETKAAVQGVPVLISDGGRGYFSRFNLVKTSTSHLEGREALDALTSVLKDTSIRQTASLATGDIIVLDNWRSLHMRPAYTPRWDGNDRWLLRIYAARGDSSVAARIGP